MHDTHCRLVTIMFVQVTAISEFNKEIPVASSRLEKHLKALCNHLKRFHGVLLEIRTGEIYAYFPGAALAFNAAVSLQQKMDQFDLRTGLHVGEVLFRQGRLQGSDVNLAARLPSCARAGGICLSQTVYQYLKDGDKQNLVAIGAHDLKNFDIRMPLYAYLPDGQASRSKGREFRQQFFSVVSKYWQKRSVKLTLLASLAALVVAIFWVQNINSQALNRHVFSLYIPAFVDQSQEFARAIDLESIEVVVRSRLAGNHGEFKLALMRDRSSATAELLIKVRQVSGSVNVEYILKSIPEALVLATGSVNQDGASLFNLQDRLSDKILQSFDKMLITRKPLINYAT